MKAETKKQLQKDIMDAYIFLRDNNYTIPSLSLDFIKNAALQKLENKVVRELFDTVVLLQKRLEILINLTPTGEKRNGFTEENIKVLELINSFNK